MKKTTLVLFLCILYVYTNAQNQFTAPSVKKDKTVISNQANPHAIKLSPGIQKPIESKKKSFIFNAAATPTAVAS